MHPADPCDPDCEILWCGECGFNEPEDEREVKSEREEG